MRIAFYYHIPVVIENGHLKVPSYLGVFLDALAHEVEFLKLVLHEASGKQIGAADYVLKATNVLLINLKIKTPAWHRVLFHRAILNKKLIEIEDCDIVLVRAPSPLAPFFSRYLKSPKTVFFVVGDYKNEASNMRVQGIRQWSSKILLLYINWLFEKKVKHSHIIVNSPDLYNKYFGIAKRIAVVRTTTLSDVDFFERTDTCIGNDIHLLYTGRLDAAKGLFELIEATANLRRRGFSVTCNIVGTEVSSVKRSIKNLLITKAKEMGIENFVIFHGWKSVGKELNEMYRKADIYVIASYHEGFPRTIWEALANSLPVVASQVGAIPYYLKNYESSLIIEPKSVDAIEKAIVSLICNSELRKGLIRNGLLVAKEVTLEKQAKVLVDFLQDYK